MQLHSSPPGSRRAAYAKVTFSVVVWGASFSATKVALQDVSPVTVVWLRFLIGVAILGAAVLARSQFALPDRQTGLYFSLLGFLGITFHQWLQSTGLETAQASTTAWIVATTPVFIALLGWLFLKERLGLLRVLGILIAGVGVLLVVTRGDLQGLFSGRSVASGDLLILISAPNWAVFSVLSRSMLQRHPAARMMFFVMLTGWIFTSLLFFVQGGPQEIIRLSAGGWVSILFLGAACSGLAYVFWYDGLQAIAATQVGAFLYMEPLVAMVVAALVLDERLAWISALGGGLILLGVWLVNRVQTPARDMSEY